MHVCQRWRQIIFASSRRLNLRILCTNGTPVRKGLDIWPTFPIVVDYGNHSTRRSITPADEDNVIAALGHPDRVCSVELNGTGSQLGKMATAMQQPFPILTQLIIDSRDGYTPVLPAKFLGKSAPSLQKISLSGIPFPALPALLLSAGDLVKLYLSNIPPTGYISPEAMVACLVALPSLEKLVITFQLATPLPDRLHPPSLKRSILPALTTFVFQGPSQYLEGLIAPIDGPRLNRIFIHYLNQLVDFEVMQVSNFIDRSVRAEFTLFKHAHVVFSRDWVYFTRRRHAELERRDKDRDSTGIRISCQGIDWQVSHMAQVLSQLSNTLSNIVHLRIWFEGIGELESIDDVEWLNLLLDFTAVQTLHVSRKVARHVALALEDIPGGMFTEVLPSLDLIYLEGQPISSLQKFAAAPRLSGRPLTIVDTRAKFDEIFKSYVGK